MFIVLDQYYIKDCFDSSSIDNATSNDRMIISISDQLFEYDGFGYDSQQSG